MMGTVHYLHETVCECCGRGDKEDPYENMWLTLANLNAASPAMRAMARHFAIAPDENVCKGCGRRLL